MSRIWLALAVLCLAFSLGAKSNNLPEFNSIEKVEIAQVNQLPQVIITTTYPATYSIYRPLDPIRIMVDFSDAKIKKEVPAQLKVNDGIVNLIKVGAEKGTPVVQVEIGLDKMMAYEVSREGSRLLVSLKPESATPNQDLYGGGSGKLIVEKSAEHQLAEPLAQAEPALNAGPVEEVEETAPASSGVQAGATVSEVPSGKVAAKLLDIALSEEDDRTKIMLVMDGTPPDYNAFQLKNPARLVLDLYKVKSLYPGKELMINSQGIKKVRIAQHPDKVRVVFDAAEAKLPSYDFTKQEERLVLVVSQKVEVSGPSAPMLAAPVLMAPAPEEAAPAPMPEVETAAPFPGTGKARVLAVDFKYTPAASLVEIKTDQPVAYERRENLADLIFSITLKDITIPSSLERSLDASEFSSPVKLVSSFQASLTEVNIVINLNAWAVPEIKQEAGKITLKFMNAGSPVAGYATPSGEEIVAPPPEFPPSAPMEQPAPMAAKSGQPIQVETLTGTKIYSGTPIKIEAKNLDILDALRAIAEVSGKNIVTADNVKGSITLKLDNVPWDQALDLILESKDLGMVQYGNVIRIAPIKDIQRAQEDQIKSKEQAEKLRPMETRIIPINSGKARDISSQLKNILSDRGKADVDERTNSIIIRDIPEKIQEAQTLIKVLDRKTDQVLIEARIVEASITAARELGVKWGVNYNAGPSWGNPTGLNFPNTVQMGGAVLGGLFNPATASVLNTAGGQGGAVGITFGSLTGAVSLDLLLQSLETQNKAKIISSPRIMTMNNERASIQQGVTIPYPPAMNLAAGGGGSQWQFVEAALRLEVTPHISSDGSMVLELRASNNTPNLLVVSGGAPSINKKEAQTQIIIKDGETIVIGGIYQTQDTETINRTPFISKIPWLGKLFQDRLVNNTRSELLIFLTPRIVK